MRAGALSGQVLAVVATARGGATAELVRDRCAALGATVEPIAWDAADGAASETAVAALLAGRHALHTLVVDAGGAFGEAHAARPGGQAALRACLDGAWNATRATANEAWIARRRGAKVIYIAPEPGAGQSRDAAVAGLENLARTLSIEWARYEILPTAIVPGLNAGAGEIAALVAFLASRAGDYYAGCRFDLGQLGLAGR